MAEVVGEDGVVSVSQSLTHVVKYNPVSISVSANPSSVWVDMPDGRSTATLTVTVNKSDAAAPDPTGTVLVEAVGLSSGTILSCEAALTDGSGSCEIEFSEDDLELWYLHTSYLGDENYFRHHNRYSETCPCGRRHYIW